MRFLNQCLVDRKKTPCMKKEKGSSNWKKGTFVVDVGSFLDFV